MTKNVKVSLILAMVMAGISLAWNSFCAYFGATGIAFVAMLVLEIILIALLVSDKTVKSRLLDVIIISMVFTVFEFIIFFANDIVVRYSYDILDAIGSTKVSGFDVFQSVISLFAIFNLIYVAFRFYVEYKGLKLSFIEILLGNKKVEKKVKVEKKSKELSNGSLEEKPNQAKTETTDNSNNVLATKEEE